MSEPPDPEPAVPLVVATIRWGQCFGCLLVGGLLLVAVCGGVYWACAR